MAAENQLTVDQLSVLAPGAAVVIESGTEFGGRRYTPGAVVRVEAFHVVVSFTERALETGALSAAR